MSAAPPLSLYIHIPWCIKKCPYCDFHSLPAKGNLPEAAYIQAMLTHAKKLTEYSQNRAIQSIFFGGGTPSMMQAKYLHRLLDNLSNLFTFAHDIEITLEANPSTFESEKFSDFFKAGINRLSIGVQSFSSVMLKRLGRVHNATEAKQAIDIAYQAGFDNINLDLMFGLPQQTLREGLDDLKQAIAFAPKHISWYQLTLEPNTRFYYRPPKLPKSEHIERLHDEGIQLLSTNGYQQYEVSAYSKNQPCRHNMNYWQFGDYLALGCGAHGKITQNGQVIRQVNQKNPVYYMDIGKPFEQETNIVASKDLPFEYMLNALRLVEGTPTDYFSARTHLPIRIIQDKLKRLYEKKLLRPFEQHIAATELGFRFLNNLLDEFMDEQHAYHQ